MRFLIRDGVDVAQSVWRLVRLGVIVLLVFASAILSALAGNRLPLILGGISFTVLFGILLLLAATTMLLEVVYLYQNDHALLKRLFSASLYVKVQASKEVQFPESAAVTRFSRFVAGLTNVFVWLWLIMYVAVFAYSVMA